MVVDEGEREGSTGDDEGVSNLFFGGIACSSLFSTGRNISGSSSSLSFGEGKHLVCKFDDADCSDVVLMIDPSTVSVSIDNCPSVSDLFPSLSTATAFPA